MEKRIASHFATMTAEQLSVSAIEEIAGHLERSAEVGVDTLDQHEIYLMLQTARGLREILKWGEQS